MSGTLNPRVDPAAVQMSRAIRVAAQASPLLVITGRAFGDLAAELGGFEAAVGELLAVAEANNRPMAVNMPTSEDTSSTVFIAPRSWPPERLSGWIAARHEELGAEFGAVTRVGVESGGAG